MPITIAVVVINFFGFVVVPNSLGISKHLQNTACNSHLNKVTNGQWHEWVAGDTSKVK